MAQSPLNGTTQPVDIEDNRRPTEGQTMAEKIIKRHQAQPIAYPRVKKRNNVYICLYFCTICADMQCKAINYV